MSVTHGFYNSKNHDRRYDAIQISSIFDGIIRDGIYMSIGDRLIVRANSGMMITVGSGRAWFNHTWTLNDSLLPLTLPDAEILMKRIDAVVLEVNAEESVRENSIKIIKGIPGTNPARPAMINTSTVHQYPLAYIFVAPGTTAIRQADITNMVGSSTTPFVSGILQTVNLDELLGQWRDQLDRFIENEEKDFSDWKALQENQFLQWSAQRATEFETWATEKRNEYLAWIEEQEGDFDQWSLEQQTAFVDWAAARKSEYLAWIAAQEENFNQWNEKMIRLSEAFERDATKQYDKTVAILNGLAGRAEDTHRQFSQDIVDFYNDISASGTQRKEAFDAEITSYIAQLRQKGDGELADITAKMAAWYAINQEDFQEWFARIQNALDADQAGHLQLQIEDQTDVINHILDMLYNGVIMAPLVTDDGYELLDDNGTPMCMESPICRCGETVAV